MELSFSSFLMLSHKLHPQTEVALCKKGVLKDFANFTEKHLCYNLFLIKRLQNWCFSVNISCNFFFPVIFSVNILWNF